MKNFPKNDFQAIMNVVKKEEVLPGLDVPAWKKFTGLMGKMPFDRLVFIFICHPAELDERWEEEVRFQRNLQMWR